MLLNHVAAILFFAGPLFYCGLWLAIAPEGIAGLITQFHHTEAPRRVRSGVRWAGIVLALVAIAL